MFQNVIVGKLQCEPHHLFANDQQDWEEHEKANTLFIEERFLPRILAAAGVASSASEVRRNKPELVKELTAPDFIRIKWGKKIIWIAVGE